MNPTIEEEFQPSMEIMLNLPLGNENMPQKILLLLNWIRGTFWKSTDNESWDGPGKSLLTLRRPLLLRMIW
jgi:hypothetical protein